MTIQSYRDLIVWQKSMTLVTKVYRLTESLPSQERFGLAAQLRASAVSIPANLAEGHSGRSRADYRRFVAMARGSLAELETRIEVGLRVGYIVSEMVPEIRSLTDEVGRMLTTLHRKLRTRGAP